MIEYRKARPDERRAYIDFIDQVFTDVDFEHTVPKVYGPDVDSAHMQNIAYDSEKGIRGLVATLPNDLIADSTVLKTGFIGSVSVHPDARGEGHMKALMNMSIDEMKNGGVDLAILNGQRQRYEYFGFVMGGVAWEYRVSSSNVNHALRNVCTDGVEFVPVEPGSPLEAEAVRLHAQEPMRFARPRFAVHCMTYIHHRLTAAVRNGELIGYLVCNDKKENLAELNAVSADALEIIVKAWICGNRLQQICFKMPDWKTSFRLRLNTWAEFVQRQPNLYVRAFNRAKAVSALLRVKAGYARLADGCVSYDVDGERFGVEVRNGEVRTVECGENPVALTGQEADRLFFAPFDYEGRPDAPCGWFPLPLFAAAPDDF